MVDCSQTVGRRKCGGFQEKKRVGMNLVYFWLILLSLNELLRFFSVLSARAWQFIASRVCTAWRFQQSTLRVVISGVRSFRRH